MVRVTTLAKLPENINYKDTKLYNLESKLYNLKIITFPFDPQHILNLGFFFEDEESFSFNHIKAEQCSQYTERGSRK